MAEPKRVPVTIPIQSRTTALLAAAALVACGPGVEPEAAPPAAAAPAASAEGAPPGYGFEVWYDDFPEQPRLSPRQPGRWYDRTRRGALEAVANNLSGTCTREAWLLAKEFFARVPAEEAAILVETLDRALQANAHDVAETTLTAMQSVGDPAFAPAIRRALASGRKGIQNAATRALRSCSEPPDLLALRDDVLRWHGSAQVFWFDALVEVLDPQRAAQELRAAIEEPRMGALRGELVQRALRLPPEQAAFALESLWRTPPDGLGPTILGLRHAATDTAGTAGLQELLRSPAPQRRRAGLEALVFGGAAVFRDRVLELTTDPDREVRYATLAVLEALGGDDAAAALEGLALDEALQVRQGALRLLRAMGRTAMLDEAIAGLRTATGSTLEILIADLVFAGEDRAIPLLVERMREAPLGEKRGFLQAIAHMRSPAGMPPLRDVFLGEPMQFGRQDRPDPALGSQAYAALLMTNLRGAEAEMLELFESIDRADYVRRALMVRTLASVAVDRGDPALAKACYDALRGVVFDTTEIPQMRLLALGYLARGITLDDVMALRRQTRDEAPPMQRALNDFLLEYF